MLAPLSLIALGLLASTVQATLTVTQPTADHWWVAQSLNTLAWTGTDPTQFSVFLANTDTAILTSILALESIVPAYDTSLTINPGTITPSTGYSLLLTNPLNSSDVYATSETFEIKAVGSSYPAQTVTANSSATVVGTGSGGSSSSAASATSTAGSKSAAFRSTSIAFDSVAGALGMMLSTAGLMAAVLV